MCIAPFGKPLAPAHVPSGAKAAPGQRSSGARAAQSRARATPIADERGAVKSCTHENTIFDLDGGKKKPSGIQTQTATAMTSQRPCGKSVQLRSTARRPKASSCQALDDDVPAAQGQPKHHKRGTSQPAVDARLPSCAKLGRAHSAPEQRCPVPFHAPGSATCASWAGLHSGSMDCSQLQLANGMNKNVKRKLHHGCPHAMALDHPMDAGLFGAKMPPLRETHVEEHAVTNARVLLEWRFTPQLRWQSRGVAAPRSPCIEPTGDSTIPRGPRAIASCRTAASLERPVHMCGIRRRLIGHEPAARDNEGSSSRRDGNNEFRTHQIPCLPVNRNRQACAQLRWPPAPLNDFRDFTSEAESPSVQTFASPQTVPQGKADAPLWCCTRYRTTLVALGADIRCLSVSESHGQVWPAVSEAFATGSTASPSSKRGARPGPFQ